MSGPSEDARVGLVIVSHSDLIARGVAQSVAQMAPDVRVEAAGGTAEGDFGTDVQRIMAAIERAESGAGVVVLCDLGSAYLSAETALELLGLDRSGQVVISDGPIVEGAVAAGVQAQVGGALAEVEAASRSAGSIGERPEASRGDDRSRGREAERDGNVRESHPGQTGASTKTNVSTAAGYTRVAVLTNPDGLHARPAAEFVKLAASLGARVTVNGRDARSLLGILSLGLTKGATVEIATVEPGGEAAVDALVALVESGFEHA